MAEHCSNCNTEIEPGKPHCVRARREVWDEAIRIAGAVILDANFSGHWQHGFAQAKHMILSQLEAARDKGREVDA